MKSSGQNRDESADKPGSVVDSHPSRAFVAKSLKQPTRTVKRRACACVATTVPIWPCSRWGLPCRSVLPPARCALTAPFQPYRLCEQSLGGILSVALAVGSRLPGVTWHLAQWSPDFPPRRSEATVWLTQR
jgi:hypothetical protein